VAAHLGIAATLAANVTHGMGHGLIGAAVAAWPAVALVGSYELLMMITRGAQTSSGHRLAGKDAVTVADLADEHLLQDPDAVPEWRDIAAELRGGSRGRRYWRCGPWRRSWSTSRSGTGSSCYRCPPPRSTPVPASAISQ
jgi:hypothetical protein